MNLKQRKENGTIQLVADIMAMTQHHMALPHCSYRNQVELFKADLRCKNKKKAAHNMLITSSICKPCLT